MAKAAPEPVAILRGHRAAVTCASFLFGSQEWLASGDADGDVLVWSVITKRVFKPFAETHSGGVLSINASENDNRWMSQGRSDGCIKLWLEYELIDVIRTKSQSFCRVAVVWDESDNLTIACTDQEESTIAVWNAGLSRPTLRFSPESDEKWGMAMDVKFVDVGGLYMIGAYEDGFVRVFDLQTSKQVPSMTVKAQPEQTPVTSLAISIVDDKGCAHCIVGGASAELAHVSFDFRGFQASFDKFFPAYHNPGGKVDDEDSKYGRGVSQICMRPDNRILAIASWDHRVRILHSRSLKHLAVLKHHRESVQTVCFSKDSNLLASGSKDKNIAIWKVYNAD